MKNLSDFVQEVLDGVKEDEKKRETEPVILCSDCCYLGDKYSFEQPNELLDTDPNNPFLKHYYCNCGDCDNYRKDITSANITSCSCFEGL